MTLLSEQEVNRIITNEEFNSIKEFIRANKLAIRCNFSSKYTGGDGFNLTPEFSENYIHYATALYASVCLSQDISNNQGKIDENYLLLMRNCSVVHGQTYNYEQNGEKYQTLHKCHGLGNKAIVVSSWKINDSAITLSRNVVERIIYTEFS